MGQIPDEFSYEKLIEEFFFNDKLISDHKQRVEKCFQFVAKKLPPLSLRTQASITKSIKSVEITFLKRWRASKYVDLHKFQQDNEKWVHTILQLPPSATSGNKRNIKEKKNFEELSDRQKNRRIEDLIENDIEMLLLASTKAAKNSNKQDLGRVLRLLSKDHQMATKILALLKDEKSSHKPEKISPMQGLTYLLDSNLSKKQYVDTRLLSKEKGANIFPSYHKILNAKKECRPLPIYTVVNDLSACLPLQQLLDHTASRLLLLQEGVLETIFDGKEIKLKLQVKWGVDGSSNHSQYNQKYLAEEDTDKNDANLFATTMVPLRMTRVDNTNKIIWNNSTPQSPRWCRPLRLHFAKETDELTINEIESVKREIEALRPFVSTIAGVTITISYEMYLTMIDGKVLSKATKTSSTQACCVCKATPKQFNNLDNIKIRFKPQEDSLNYGLSVLHLWIRSFEWLLHVSYRKDIGKWQARGSELKLKVKNRKRLVQKRFLDSKFNIRVDFPAPGGTGNSNNGNVCRKAFSDPDLLAEILELDKELVNRIRIILIALSCQLPLDAELFNKFCIDTAHHYVKEYWWYPFPPTVHKALIHSRDIMLANDLPVGVLAEDAAESCHKLYRNNRQFHARKDSRRHNLMDVFNRALDSSDPIIASFGLQKRQNYRRRLKLPAEVLSLLRPPDDPTTEEQEFEEDLEDDLSPNSNALDDILEELDFDALDLSEDPFHIESGDEEDEEEDQNN